MRVMKLLLGFCIESIDWAWEGSDLLVTRAPTRPQPGPMAVLSSLIMSCAKIRAFATGNLLDASLAFLVFEPELSQQE